MITMWDGSVKPIEEVVEGDDVMSFDAAGNLVAGRVKRTMVNDVKIILGFFGTFVTPGHVYYRPDSKKAHKFEALIDIIRDDGVIQHQEGRLIRAATGADIGSPRDEERVLRHCLSQENLRVA